MDQVTRGKSAVHKVTVVTPHPVLWRAALERAGGDARRIEIVSETNLVVHPERR